MNIETQEQLIQRRIKSLLEYNNNQVELRRVADRLLREAANKFRFYESQHRLKLTMLPADTHEEIARRQDTLEKAEVNAEIAGRIENYLLSIHE